MSRSERRIDDRYELLDELATGGVGTVWRCRDVRSGSEHTVTLLRPRPNRQDAALEAIVPVLNAIEQLAHPHIVVTDEVVAGEDWIAVIAQPTPADDLHSLLRQHGPMPPPKPRTSGHSSAKPSPPRTTSASHTASSSRPPCCSNPRGRPVDGPAERLRDGRPGSLRGAAGC